MEPLSREALSKLAKDVKDLGQNAIDGVKVGWGASGWHTRSPAAVMDRIRGAQGVRAELADGAQGCL